jgi:hypothetical protein
MVISIDVSRMKSYLMRVLFFHKVNIKVFIAVTSALAYECHIFKLTDGWPLMQNDYSIISVYKSR